MAIDAKKAAQDIAASVAAVHKPMAEAGAMAAAISPPAGFCDIWKKAKPVLETISGIITFIPGLGSVAGGVLTGLIKIGDQISAEVCTPAAGH